MYGSRTLIATLCALSLATAVPAQVTPAPAAQPPTGAAAPSPTAKTFSQQDLDQMLASIALYPDALLAQVLMASTYPLEVVAAARWVKANPTLKDKALEDALQTADVGPEREVARGVPAGADDDEREARLDAEARRRVPRAAEGRDGDRAGAARRRRRRRAR